MEEESCYDSHIVRLGVITKEKVFQYYKDVEDYPKRYPKYCQSVEVTESSNNTITTKEFWNVTTDKDTDHAIIQVQYTLTEPTEIRYEILSGHMKGIKNRIHITENDEYKSIVELSLPILDMTGHPIYGNKSTIYQDLLLYFEIQDIQHLANYMTMFQLGQKCPKCNKFYTLGAKPSDIMEVENNKRTIMSFECDAVVRYSKILLWNQEIQLA
jgi:ribosome-associated toxin RatA of RatAB toxin-antitoxin module